MFKKYVEAGWGLVLVEGKKPVHRGWNQAGNAIIAPDVVQPGYNYGLAHVTSKTCAIDIDDVDAATHWLDDRGVDLVSLISDISTVMISSGKKNHAKLLYRLSEPLPRCDIKQDGHSVIDFRCANPSGTTIQDVLPPSLHPDTGQPYFWQGLGSWERLPELPEELLQLWTAEISASTPPVPDNVVQLPFAGSGQDITAALQSIPADVAYGDWLNVGMALHASGMPVEVWDQWSAQGAKYKTGECAHKWRSFSTDKSSLISSGTLFAIARQNGWQPPLGFEPLQGAAFVEASSLVAALPDCRDKDHPVDPLSYTYLAAVRETCAAINQVDDIGQASLIAAATNRLQISKTQMAKFLACTKGLRDPRKAIKWHSTDTRTGLPQCTQENVRALLEANQAVVQFDTMRQVLTLKALNGVPWDPGEAVDESGRVDRARMSLEDLARRAGLSLDGQTFINWVYDIANHHKVHPFDQWVSDSTWDGVSRVDDIVDSLIVAKSEQRWRDVMVRKWLVSVMSFVYGVEPPADREHAHVKGSTKSRKQSYISRSVLVLHGAQDIGKSSWFLTISPPDMGIGGSTINPDNRDSLKNALEYLICELSEFETSSTSKNVGKLKEFVTAPQDFIRELYVNKAGARPRRTAICASVNKDTFLHDETGNTRYLPVHVNRINWDIVNEICNDPNEHLQLWLELLHMYHEGFPYQLTVGEKQQLTKISMRYTSRSEAHEALNAVFDMDDDRSPSQWDWWSIARVQEKVNSTCGSHFTPKAIMDAMKQAKLKNQRKWIDGGRPSLWQVPRLRPNMVLRASQMREIDNNAIPPEFL